jgi:hypothetical protein
LRLAGMLAKLCGGETVVGIPGFLACKQGGDRESPTTS